MTDPHEIAVRLTEAQRAALTGPLRQSVASNAAPYIRTFASTHMALNRKALVTYSGQLTPIGLAVRQVLLAAEKESG